MFESMKYEINRLNSFRGEWPLNCIKPEDLAEAGFFYLKSEDRVLCPFCYVMIFNWKAGDRPLEEHLSNSPACSFLLSSDVGNVPLSRRTSSSLSKLSPEKSRYSARSASASKPKPPAMADIKRRLLTYRSWPLTMLTPQQLSECGLFYTGFSDIVTCFFCGESLGNWELEDDPWAEHAKFFPDCAFAHSKDHHQSMQKLKERTSNMTMKLTEPVSLNIIVSEQPMNLLNNEIVHEAMEIFAESLVQKVVLEHFSTEGRNFASLHELCEAILVYDETKNKSVGTPVSSYSSYLKLICSEEKTIENVPFGSCTWGYERGNESVVYLKFLQGLKASWWLKGGRLEGYGQWRQWSLLTSRCLADGRRFIAVPLRQVMSKMYCCVKFAWTEKCK